MKLTQLNTYLWKLLLHHTGQMVVMLNIAKYDVSCFQGAHNIVHAALLWNLQRKSASANTISIKFQDVL